MYWGIIFRGGRNRGWGVDERELVLEFTNVKDWGGISTVSRGLNCQNSYNYVYGSDT